MSKVMKLITVFSSVITIITAILFYCYKKGLYLSLAITFGTIFYHLGIRLFVGLLYNIVMKNRADYTKKWYHIHSWESRLYQLLKVKQWKDKMPAYNPEFFSIKEHTWDEIAQAMCQSELVHETNIILSFVPIISSKWFDSFYVFFITSICSAIFDLLFVIIQRYNRVRVIKMASRKKEIPAEFCLAEESESGE